MEEKELDLGEMENEDYEPEQDICGQCLSSPCDCPEEPTLEPPEIGYEPPCMIEPDFYNCENCGAEIEMGYLCQKCDEREIDIDIEIDNLEEDNWQERMD